MHVELGHHFLKSDALLQQAVLHGLHAFAVIELDGEVFLAIERSDDCGVFRFQNGHLQVAFGLFANGLDSCHDFVEFPAGLGAHHLIHAFAGLSGEFVGFAVGLGAIPRGVAVASRERECKNREQEKETHFHGSRTIEAANLRILCGECHFLYVKMSGDDQRGAIKQAPMKKPKGIAARNTSPSYEKGNICSPHDTENPYLYLVNQGE